MNWRGWILSRCGRDDLGWNDDSGKEWNLDPNGDQGIELSYKTPSNSRARTNRDKRDKKNNKKSVKYNCYNL